MALTDNNVNESQDSQRAAAPKGNPQHSQRRLNTDIFESGQLVQAGVSGNELTTFIERFNAYHDANKAALSAGGQLTWAVIPATSGETKMKLDAAVVVGKAVTGGIVTTCALTLLFTGGQALPKQSVEVGNRSERQYSAVANDQFTDAYQIKLAEIIGRKAPDLAGDIVQMGAVAITNAQLTEAKCEDLIISAVNAVFGYLGNMLRTEHFNLGAAIDAQRSEFVSRVIYNQGDAHDEITERPRRRDLSVEVSLATKGQRNRVSNALENAEGAMDIATIEGFVDVTYLGRPDGQSRRSRYRSQREEDEARQIYGKNLVITHMKHEASPEHLCLALAQIPVLINENVLTAGLKPAGDNAKLRTPVALTYELDEEFKDVPDVLDDVEWADLTDVVIQPDQNFVTILIDETGITTQQQKLLLQATDPMNSNRDTYADMLVIAGDNLTEGEFSAQLALNKVRPLDIGERQDRIILLGDWNDDRGQIRSLTEIDYYAIVTAFGKKDPRMVQDWDRCQNDSSLPIEVRLAKMEEIIDQFTGGSYRITGHGVPVLVNTQWLFALTNAAEKVGMVTQADGIYQDTRFRRGFQSQYATSGYSGKAFRMRGTGRSDYF